MDLQLHGKTALVTGGSEGIGKGIAIALAKEGVDVAICARRKDVLEATAKDVALAFIGRYKTDYDNGFALEFSGETVFGLSMESRMTLCNMAVEAGARCALIGVDDTVIE